MKTKYNVVCAYGSITYDSYNNEWRKKIEEEKKDEERRRELEMKAKEDAVKQYMASKGVKMFEEYRRLILHLDCSDEAYRKEIIHKVQSIQKKWSKLTPEVKEIVFQKIYLPGTTIDVVCKRVTSKPGDPKKTCECRYKAVLHPGKNNYRMFQKAFIDKDMPLLEVRLYDKHKCIKCFNRLYNQIKEEGTMKRSHQKYRKELIPIEPIIKGSYPEYD
jgi:hypothetical protein